MTTHILHINSSGRSQDSVTRNVSTQVIEHLSSTMNDINLTERDLAPGVPFINENWIGANFTPAAERLPVQNEFLSDSHALVEEIEQADVMVIASPIYNFSVPAVLKAWIDQIARAQLTFKYTEQGPVGLMTGKRAILVMASGGVPIGSDLDFATPYLQQIMRFIGIDDITVVDANQANQAADWTVAQPLAGFTMNQQAQLEPGVI